jgi:peptidoglycan pentaglycine glycine transferase (the first glycine)
MHISTSAKNGALSPREWDEWVRAAGSGHLLQSCAWGDLKAHFGWQPLRIAAMEGHSIVAGAQVLFRRLLGSRLTTAYVPKGPVIAPSTLRDASTASLLSALQEVCRRRRALSLKLEPDWEASADAQQWLQSQGFVESEHTVQPKRTILIDLRPSEQDILAQMRSKTRYNIRLAQRRSITVHMGNADDLPSFYRLLQVTAERAGFGVHTRAYYSLAWQLFEQQEAAALLVAWYMYGASSDEERRRMPTYLLQWEAMRWAKSRGCATYDLWGIPDVDESAVGSSIAEAEAHGVLSRGMGGLYRFKRGFGGREVRYVGAFDYSYNRPLYRLFSAVWQSRHT